MATLRLLLSMVLLATMTAAMTTQAPVMSVCTLRLHQPTRANVTTAFARSVARGSTVVRFHLYLVENASESESENGTAKGSENGTEKGTENGAENGAENEALTDSNNGTENTIHDETAARKSFIRYIEHELLTHPPDLVAPFRARGEDTFAPWLWVWARKNGKYILRVPMDYHVLSAGILSLYMDDMDLPLVEEPAGCTEHVDYQDVQNMVTHLIYDDVIHALELDPAQVSGAVIGRSAYMFRYYLGRVIGVKGCNQNAVTGNYTCESNTYMKGWEMTWFGPLAVTILFYLFILLTIYKEYFTYKELRGGNDRDIQKQISVIGQKILRDVHRIKRELYGQSVEDNFLEFLQHVNFLDILGVSKTVQKRVIFVMQIIVTLILLGVYYGIGGYSIYFHGLKNQKNLIAIIENSHEIYANVFGHLAWLYADPSIRLKTYAMVEAVITFLVPLFMVFLYVMFTERIRREDVILKEKQNHQNNGTGTLESQVEVRYASCMQAFAHSKFGIFIAIILGIIVIMFWLCIGGVYMIYSLYMIGVGSFLTLNLFAGWMLPACLCLYYAYEVFTPLFELYTISKQKIFAEIHKRGYLVKTDDYMLCPTSLIESFYYNVSRGKVFEGFQRVFVALALLLMLFLVFIASQYPDFDITTKNSNLVMGVHIAIILPFLANMMQARAAMTDFEKAMIEQDVERHVTSWEEDNGVMVEALKLRVEKLKKHQEEEQARAHAAQLARAQQAAHALRRGGHHTRGGGGDTEGSREGSTPPRDKLLAVGVGLGAVVAVESEGAIDRATEGAREAGAQNASEPSHDVMQVHEPGEEGLEMNELTPFISQDTEEEAQKKSSTNI